MKYKLNMQADKPTKNGRIYPRNVLENALKNKKIPIINLDEYFDFTKIIPSVDISKIVGYMKSYEIDENGEIKFDIEYIKTPTSENVKQIMEVSDDYSFTIWGLAIVKENIVQNNLRILGIVFLKHE